MSILQEYEQIRRMMGNTRYDSIEEYLDEVNKDRESELFLSDVLYKEHEYKKFDDWFNKKISPFKIMPIKVDLFSVTLNQEDYVYDFKNEVKDPNSIYGDGHSYNDLFHDYLEANTRLNRKLTYDSENGMFCVYAHDVRDADSVAYTLSSLYKDENKMIDCIKETKEKYGYQFDVHI